MHILHINTEIKFLYAKRGINKKSLYQLHVENGKQWGSMWNVINQNITDKLNINMNAKYRLINNKINKLKEQKTHKPRTKDHLTIPFTNVPKTLPMLFLPTYKCNY
jgi:hypothetical protein